MPFRGWWIGWWAYRCHLDVDRVRDSLARTCVPAKEKMSTWHVAGAGFQMLGIDVSWLVTGAGSGASNGDEWTRGGYYLSMNGERTLGDFNFNNARWANLGGKYHLRSSGKRTKGNYKRKGNYISRTIGERTIGNYNLKAKPKNGNLMHRRRENQ